jgi:ATP-dependent Clp protease protease subunit
MQIPKLLQLAIENKAAPKAFEVKAAANGDAEIYLYDVIDSYWGVGATAFCAALKGVQAETIHLHINSPGGDVFEARAMVAAIAASKATLVAHIDGLAASAASYVAMACDEVRIADGAFFMIHNAWTVAMGNANDLRASAELLAKVDSSIVSDYMRRTGKDQAQIEQWMADETWFSAQEAVDNGFANAVVANEKGVKNAWNLAAYAKAPKALTEPVAPLAAEINEEIEAIKAARSRHLALLERI